MNLKPLTINKQHVRRTFNRAAVHYQHLAKLQQTVGQRMIERLQWIRVQPQRILDLGCGSGYFLPLLAEKYPEAEIIALDLAENMLQEAKQQHSKAIQYHAIQADLDRLPIAANSIDLVFANLSLHWSQDIYQLLHHIFQIMKANSLLVFTAPGPETLIELRRCWQAIDHDVHVHYFSDMQQLGSALQSNAYSDPVLDRETFTLYYSTLFDMLKDLRDLGVTNAMQREQKGLMGRAMLNHLAQHYEKYRAEHNHKLPTTYEIIYAHAWKLQDDGQRLIEQAASEIQIPLHELKRKRY